ncbi:MAG: hypothetical protein LBK54_11330 [Propionibacteriaceae bacterium]|jgi:hypothetical protein|nr:hypothetical protein [Propionibacteriaceae bacterium]
MPATDQTDPADQAGWAESMGLALTGQSLGLTEPNDPAQLLAGLAERGWDAAALRRRAQAAWADGRPWPEPLPAARLSRIGAARWQAGLDQVGQALGLRTLSQPPSRRTSLTADERRLLADRPPHHGS